MLCLKVGATCAADPPSFHLKDMLAGLIGNRQPGEIILAIDPALPAFLAGPAAAFEQLLAGLLDRSLKQAGDGPVRIVVEQIVAPVINILMHVKADTALPSGDGGEAMAPFRSIAAELGGVLGISVQEAGTTLWVSLPLGGSATPSPSSPADWGMPDWRQDVWPDIDPAILNVSRLLAPFGGAADEAGKLLQQFLAAVPARILAIDAAMARAHWAEAAQIAQRLKHRAQALGAGRLAMVAANLADMLEDGHPEIAAMLFRLLDPMLAELREGLSGWLGEDGVDRACGKAK